MKLSKRYYYNIFVSDGSVISSGVNQTIGNVFINTTLGSSSVGINTSSPNHALDVFGSSNISDNLFVTTISASNLSLSNNINVAGTLTVLNITTTNLIDTNLTSGIIRVTNNLSAIGNSNTIGNIFTTDGNVGIGITTPTTTLDVTGTARFTTSLTTGALYSTNLTSSNIVGTNISANNLSVTTFSPNSISSGTLSLSTGLTSANANITNISASNLSVTTSLLALGSNTLGTIITTTSGGVGIGTTAPLYALHIANSSGSSGMRIGYSIANGSGNFTHLSMTTSSLTGGSCSIQSTKSDGAEWGTLTLNPAGGNIGIGTASPSYKLDVSGNVRAYQSAFFTSTINTSAINGTWVSPNNYVDLSASQLGITGNQSAMVTMSNPGDGSFYATTIIYVWSPNVTAFNVLFQNNISLALVSNNLRIYNQSNSITINYLKVTTTIFGPV